MIARMKFERITIDPARMNGQPCIRDTRLTVRRVLELIEIYADRGELFREFPELTPEDIEQTLAFARSQLPDRTADMVELA